MLKVDKAILDTDKVICKNIDRFDSSERGLLSQNILAQLRNLVEYIAQKIHSNGNDTDPNEYQHKKESWEYIQTQGNLKFLYDFHSLLQKSVSHYTIDENGSERLMLRYYEYLLKIKIFLNNAYNIEVLTNIDKFPLNLDRNLMEYYEKISYKIIYNNQHRENAYKDKYYIQKIKPFFVNNSIYYEVTFTLADDKTSKFDRIIAFTKYEILSNYSVKLQIREDVIEILDSTMPIKIIDGWEVSVRDCEFKNFSKIFNMQPVSSGSQEYYALMDELTVRKMNFVDIVNLSDRYYDVFRSNVINKSKTKHFINVLDHCRYLIKNNRDGANIIKYLLLKLNNKIIKKQYNYDRKCHLLSDLRLNYGCIPFEQMPFCTSLMGHNPKITDLFDCINSKNREHEFLARLIKNNTEQQDMIFTPISEVTMFQDVMSLVNSYNNKLYKTHKKSRSISVYKNHLYINEYVDDCVDVIKKIEELSSNGVDNYRNYVANWLQNNESSIDCNEKKNLLENMFCDSRVSLIYGAAGTGKSTLINHISNLWGGKKKVYLANTNPAVNNLKRKVNSANCEFMTITKFLSNRYLETDFDLLFIDECSTVSNQDMNKVMQKAKFKLLVLVGDVYQIESISFGNWFSIIRNFIKSSSILELKKPYRTNNENLITVWNRVRDLDIAILEPFVKNNHSIYLGSSILNKPNTNEIILSLNYDGIYGINNINRFLQNSNKNNAVNWGVNAYKIDDPILFNESDRFSPLIYNNLKGKIVDIELEENKIFFSIEIDMVITEIDAMNYDFELLSNDSNDKSIIRFHVNKYQGVDEDDEHTDSLVPFQVTYALSIHKAQGLEYDSVKIVITNEVEELITHSIFYTAITRTKNQLKIYWTPETEKKVLNNFKTKNLGRDIGLLKSFIKDKYNANPNPSHLYAWWHIKRHIF